MKKSKNSVECQYYQCMRCDEQFYCPADERRPSCPHCGSHDEESIVALSDKEKDYDESYYE